MMLKIILLALFALGACSEGQSNDVAESQPSAVSANVEPATAVLTCRVNGTLLDASACLIAGAQPVGGGLKITSGGQTKDYTDYDVLQQVQQSNGPALELPLKEPFQIAAQANGDSAMVLRLEIRRGGKIIFQDEATEFNAILVSSEELS